MGIWEEKIAAEYAATKEAEKLAASAERALAAIKELIGSARFDEAVGRIEGPRALDPEECKLLDRWAKNHL